MFKKIISAIFASILIIFSAMTVVSCTATNISTGLQRLFYKNAQIASFAASAAILNDEEEAKATSKNSVLGGKAIGQKYLMDKYSQMTVDSALGKDFLVNQNSETKMGELFESTFNDTSYTYVSNQEIKSENSISSNNDTGYKTGTTILDSINGSMESILDTLTIGISPSTLSTIINLIFREKITVNGLSLSGVFEILEDKDNEYGIEGIMDDYVLDYQSANKNATINEVLEELNSDKQSAADLVQYIKTSLKAAYSFFDVYIKNKSVSDFETYINKTTWSSISDNVINFSKLTNLLKYASTSDIALAADKTVAKDALSTSLMPAFKNILAELLPKLLPKILPLVLPKLLPMLVDNLGGWAGTIGNALQDLLTNEGIITSWGSESGEKLITSISNTINQLLKYVESQKQEDFEALLEKNIKPLITQIGNIVQRMDEEFYQANVRSTVENIISSIDLSGLPAILQKPIKEAANSAYSLGSLFKLATSFLAWRFVKPIISDALKPLLEGTTVDEFYKKITDLIVGLVDKIPYDKLLDLLDMIDFESLINQQPLAGIDESNFLSQVGDDASFMPLLGAFKNISIENIAKFLADRLEPITKDVSFDLNNVSEMLKRVKYTKVKIDKNELISLSEFTDLGEDPYNNPKPLVWTDTVNFYDTRDGKETFLYGYEKANAPAEHQQVHMAFGLDQIGGNVLPGSLGEMVVKTLGKDSGELLYSISNIIQDLMINLPNESNIRLDKKFFEPLYKRSNWTMDEFGKFKKSLPENIDMKNPKFTFNVYRVVPDTGNKKTYKVTIRQGDDNYWTITNITK